MPHNLLNAELINNQRMLDRNSINQSRTSNLLEINGQKIKQDENYYQSIGLGHKSAVPTKNSASEIGDFMQLFLAQLKNQDPLDPQDGAEFVAQLAQFNTVEGIQKLNTTVGDMANAFKSGKILESTGMIGKKIEIGTGKITVKEGDDSEITGTLKIPDINKGVRKGEPIRTISEVKAFITSENGELIEEMSLKQMDEYKNVTWKGNESIRFAWDKMVNNSDYENNNNDSESQEDVADKKMVEPGKYRITAKALVGNKWIDVPTTISSKVNSISIDGDNVTLNAVGIGSIALKDLKEVSE